MEMKKNMKLKSKFSRMTFGDVVFSAVTYIFIGLVILATVYPFIYIISCSISDSGAVARGEVWLTPVGVNFNAYERVVTDSRLWRSYGNTLFIVVAGTLINLAMTTSLAYPLSRPNFSSRRVLMVGVTITMFFSGGMVPTYLLVKNLGLINNIWALILPVAISTYNLIVTRTFLEGIPESLHEAATIDGANELQIFIRIYLPLSKAILATMTLFYAVSHWNGYFNAMLYLNKESLQPLQIFLRNVLIQYEASEMMTDIIQDRDSVSQTIRYATIMISVIPIMCVYPFLQKYFVKGVMIGAVKG